MVDDDAQARRAPGLYAAAMRLFEEARADDWRMRRAVDAAIDRLTAMLDAGRVSRTELQAIVEELRAAVELPSVYGDHRAADAETEVQPEELS